MFFISSMYSFHTLNSQHPDSPSYLNQDNSSTWFLFTALQQTVADECQRLSNGLTSDAASVACKMEFSCSSFSGTAASHKYGSYRCLFCSAARTGKTCNGKADVSFSCFCTAFCHFAETAPSFFNVLFFTPRHFLFARFV